MAGFAKSVNKFARVTGESNTEVMANVAFKAFSATIKATPVDTGRARANWQATSNTPAAGVLDTKTDPTAKVARAVEKGKSQGVWFLTNNLPYAQTLEFGGYPGDGPNTVGGFSTQARKGMLRVNFARIENLLIQEARRL